MLKPLLYSLRSEMNTRRLLAGLRRELGSDSPLLLVHQMGRVGSMTLVNTLRAMQLPWPIYHTHYLNPANLASNIERRRKVQWFVWQRHLRVARLLSRAVTRRRDARQWYIVSTVREPIGRNLSNFILDIERFHIRDFFRRYEQGRISIEQALEIFFREFNHDAHTDWIRDELNANFGLDVYSEPFNPAQGYQILHCDNIHVLIFQLERFDEVFRTGLEAFFDRPAPEQPVHTHISSRDERAGTAYREMLSRIRLPDDYIERMYDSDYMRHFYTSEQIERFRRKWRRQD
ncbi:putative capsular polysaccharide synthesis family protein [Thiohalobacter thiocyanaticus]|uniref:Uncharacterized protein n=1 Tax=Thiohalobacter thiocyanaticus TaxID=585455 RepID=A0A426QM52_9GAMM|nr:putative capsular polysaccharide synthesis family protein [Thiohalobacter thiocyanaticus]RRQ22838.1 hypothetical protein D6C00_13470 [Thiohalobacter thiocyanaticus]